eukprot:3842716-Pyramimonas_sp.AAC.1
MPPQGQASRQPGQSIGIDRHMQEEVRHIEDSQLPFQSPAGIAGQATGRAATAQCAVGPADQFSRWFCRRSRA